MQDQNKIAQRVYRGKSWNTLLSLSVTALVISIGLFSCKKDKPKVTAAINPPAPKMSVMSGGSAYGKMTDTEIDAIVTQFYSDVTALKNENNSAADISLQEAVLKMEATYNKYVVVTDYAADIASDKISFYIPANKDGSVNMKEAANTFWAIKSELLTRQGNLTENNVVPTLEAFDLELITDAEGNPKLTGGNYTLEADIAFARPIGGNPPVEQVNNNIFKNSATHCWRSYGSSDGAWVESGQATIDHPNKTVIASSIDLSKPSAPTALRTLGIHNYQQAYGQTPPGYAFNISTVGGSANYYVIFPVMPATNCDYVTRGIADYTNKRWWDTKIHDDPSTDPYVIYKHWLTTPMMNYYVAAIKDVINLNIAPGRYFYNFHIETSSASGGQNPYTFRFHEYHISSSKLIGFVPHGLSLSEL